MKRFALLYFPLCWLLGSCYMIGQDNPLVIESVVPCESSVKDNVITVSDGIVIKGNITGLKSPEEFLIKVSGNPGMVIYINSELPVGGAVFNIESYSDASKGSAGILLTSGADHFESTGGQLYVYFNSNKPVVAFCDVRLSNNKTISGRIKFH
jgi:hypothetical protein